MSEKPNKLAFLSMPAPASYVAGLGRGASGFTTRSDIGPAREGPSAEAIAEAQAKRGEDQEYDPDQFQDPDNEFGLFSGASNEEDDREAEMIYDAVDEAMDARRRARREQREREELARERRDRPKIQQQFADLKRGLSAVTDEEWDAIPEVSNLSRKKKAKMDRSYAVPDSIVVGDRSKSQYENDLDTSDAQDSSGTMTNFVEIGQARDKVLSLKLDQVSKSSTSSGLSTSIDPKGYLTSLQSEIVKSEAEIGDIKRARMLFDSLVKSNPKHAPGWIAYACLEEHAGRMVAARKLIKQGCEHCPTSEDIWLEAARLHQVSDAKVVLANAVQHVGQQSVKVWIAAADLENDDQSKKRVFRRALEQIPNSVRLWKQLINLEGSAVEARVLLSRAVELNPLSVELWLALANLETLGKAKAVLNRARKTIPTSHEIWIAAVKLVEKEVTSKAAESGQEVDPTFIDKTMAGGVRTLRDNEVSLTREQWLEEAENSEKSGFPYTCGAVIKATISFNVEEDDQLETWAEDARNADSKGMVHTARAILAYALKVYPNKVSLWQQAAELEKSNGSPDATHAILARAVEHCPTAVDLWLMGAKEKWLGGDVPAAREILERAFGANLQSEKIWLAAVKLEAANGEHAVARKLLARAREEAGTEKVWVKSVKLEYQQKQLPQALDLLAQALAKFPKFAKLYIIQGQIYEHQKEFARARAAYAAGLKACPKEPELWQLASRLEEKDGKSIRARALLDKARLANPKNEDLWAETVAVEQRAGSEAQAKAMLARGLQDCPQSGVLWSAAIWAEPRPSRKTKSADALQKSNNHPLVICTVARLFWAERKIEKARDWFQRAIKAAPDLGDLWGWWLRFEKQHGMQEHRDRVIQACIEAQPKHSPTWRLVAKDPDGPNETKDILIRVADLLA